MKLSVFHRRAFRGCLFLLALAALAPLANATNNNNNNNNNNNHDDDRDKRGNVYSGQATAVHITGVVNPPGLNPITIADTGALGADGGAKPAMQRNVSIAGGGLTTTMAASLATGGSNEAMAVASLTNFHAEFVTEHGAHFTIEADSICAGATAGGSAAGRLDADEKVQICGLRINGVAVKVTGQANQVIVVGDSRIILNERTEVTERTSCDAAVTAIHFFTCECIEGWLCRVDAGITLVEKPTKDCYERSCRDRDDHRSRYCGRD